MLIMLPGCASVLPGNDCREFCRIARPIYLNASDTEQTKAAVDIHNAVWLELCE